MDQIDMFETYGAHEVTEYLGLDHERCADSYNTKMDRRVSAAFGSVTRSAEELEKFPHLTPGTLKFRKKLVMVHEFTLVTSDKAKARMSKNAGVVNDTLDRNPQYLINLYNHTSDVAMFVQDFASYMEQYMNAVHLFTVATVYDGRLLIFVENGAPLITSEESLEMLGYIERFINKSKVYRVLSGKSIYRTI